MDTHDMKPSSEMDEMELSFVDLICSIVIISPSLTKIDQYCFHIIVGLFIEPYCSKNSCDFLLSSDHEYVFKQILDSHIL
jgi:hypothetical protein